MDSSRRTTPTPATRTTKNNKRIIREPTKTGTESCWYLAILVIQEETIELLAWVAAEGIHHGEVGESGHATPLSIVVDSLRLIAKRVASAQLKASPSKVTIRAAIWIFEVRSKPVHISHKGRVPCERLEGSAEVRVAEGCKQQSAVDSEHLRVERGIIHHHANGFLNKNTNPPP